MEMDDPLWGSMEVGNFDRKQLALVVPEKKVKEIYQWFADHFVNCTTTEYVARCPIVILQGPTGCGKTSTLKWISNELQVPIREYSETTDVTDVMNDHHYESVDKNEEGEQIKSSQSIYRRKAARFEHFIIDKIIYNQLYPINQTLKPLATADSEFESDDEDEFCSLSLLTRNNHSKNSYGNTTSIKQDTKPRSTGRLIKVIRNISPGLLRRAAIVFETLEGDGEIISLPTKVKTLLKIQVLKFNPITQANMKNFVKSLTNDLRHITIDKDTIDQIVFDSDGDIRACINTLQLICNKSPDQDSDAGAPFLLQQANKKQKLKHEKVREVKLNPGLMRDNNRSLVFFHVLGKIFYQKRLYPCLSKHSNRLRPFRSIERPFPLENSTEYLASLMDVEPKNLITWLHQHYYMFCHDSKIDKAALFLDNLSAADTTSLNSTQSTQFYEMHQIVDQIQTHVAIESTTFSLYEDQTKKIKDRQKKIQTDFGPAIIKSSVENPASHTGELYSFNKPVLMNITKLIENYETLLHCCRAKLFEVNGRSTDPLKVLLDYVPYISHISDNWAYMKPELRAEHYSDVPELYSDRNTLETLMALNNLEVANSDLENRIERLAEMIEKMKICPILEELNASSP